MTNPNSSNEKAARDDEGVNVKRDAFGKMVEKLKENKGEEGFPQELEEQLWMHFSHLPDEYALDVERRVQDVLQHQRLLNLLVADPSQGFVFEIRSVKPSSSNKPSSDDAEEAVTKASDSNCALKEDAQSDDVEEAVTKASDSNHALKENAQSDVDVKKAADSEDELQISNQHELTFVSTFGSKPNVFNQLAPLVSDLGLNILESHAFDSTDGHSLHIFVVDGWIGDIGVLKEVLLNHVLKIEQMRKEKMRKKVSKWKPTRASVSDHPFETVRKHMVVTFSERLFKRLLKVAENNDAVASNIIKISSFGRRTKNYIMNKLLLNQPCEFTNSRTTFNTKQASLSIAKTTATIFVATIFGVLAVGSDVIPAANERRKRSLEMVRLERGLNNIGSVIAESYAKFSDLLKMKEKSLKNEFKKTLEDKFATETKDKAELKARVLILEQENAEFRGKILSLEEDAAKRKTSSWFSWFKGSSKSV